MGATPPAGGQFRHLFTGVETIDSIGLCRIFLVLFLFFIVSQACDDDDDDHEDHLPADDDDNNDNNDTADEDFGFVVFSRFNGENVELLRLDEPLREPTVLIADGFNRFPTVSPDGKTIVFDSNLHDPDPGATLATMLYRLPSTGGSPERITDEDWLVVTEDRAVFSPDGSLIAYVRTSAVEAPPFYERIWFIDADGGNRRALYPGDTTPRNDYAPAFSPDGKRLVYLSETDTFFGEIFIADLSTTPATREQLTESVASVVAGNYRPFFDASGQWLFFESSRDDGYGLYRLPAAGGTPELVWEIGLTAEGPLQGMAAVSDIRPGYDRCGLAASQVVTDVERIVLINDFTQDFALEAITDATQDCFHPFWWRPTI